MADEFELTDAEREEWLPSRRQRVIDNRVGWAMTYLVQAGLAERPRRAHLRITEAGRRALVENPDRIDMKTLERYPSYLEFKTRGREAGGAAGDDVTNGNRATELDTPEALLDAALAQNTAAIEAELAQRMLGLSPTGFEELVIRLLEKMGYGKAGGLERTPPSGDGGVDGIISQDPLGLDRIYVQAKRYAPDNVITRPKVQEFVGALFGKQGDRGVYITTSSFSTGAREEADRINARIELIDGRRLAQLMVQHGVGVEPAQTVTLHRIDEDLFEEMP
jgi:restriction system protein